jgi:hypothetical protein
VSEFGLVNQLTNGFPEPPPVDPTRPARGTTRSIFDKDFRDGYAHNFNLNVQKQLGTNYLVELAYAGSRGRHMMAKVDPNQAQPVVGVNNSNINRPYFSINPLLTTLGQAKAIGYVDYNGLLVKFQRRFANNFSFLNSYTFGKAIDLNSDNDGTVTFLNVYDIEGYHRAVADYDVKHTFSSSWIYELPWMREKWYGGWQVNGIFFWRTGLPFNLIQTSNVASTGTQNRPNRLCDGKLSHPTIDAWFDLSCFEQTSDTTGTYGNAGRNILRGPGQVNVDMSLIKRTRVAKVDTEFRVEAFNVLNHPQFANPPESNRQIGNPQAGRISASLANPACALCGTTERQIQLAVKVQF